MWYLYTITWLSKPIYTISNWLLTPTNLPFVLHCDRLGLSTVCFMCLHVYLYAKPLINHECKVYFSWKPTTCTMNRNRLLQPWTSEIEMFVGCSDGQVVNTRGSTCLTVFYVEMRRIFRDYFLSRHYYILYQ